MYSSDVASCRGDGSYDGRNGEFSQGLYDICGDSYYDAFIDGCMSADNSRDVCESATDAGDSNIESESESEDNESNEDNSNSDSSDDNSNSDDTSGDADSNENNLFGN